MSLLYLAICGGVAAGVASGGSLRRLASLRLRHSWLLLLSVAVQWPLIFRPPVAPAEGVDPLRVGLPLAGALAVAFAIANRRLPGMRLALLGATANLLVIVANGGLMPTHEAALQRAGMTTYLAAVADQPGMRLPRSKDVLLPLEETRLWWLSDTLVGPPVPPARSVMSVGDVFLATGLATLAAQATRAGMARQQAARPSGGGRSRHTPISISSPGASQSWSPQP
jgi:hypothetical protein